MLTNITTPKAQDSVATLLHVRILRLVKTYSFLLSVVWLWEVIRVTVPIVAVELYDKVLCLYEGIDTELSRYNKLGQIWNIQTIKNVITDYLNLGGMKALLLGIHSQQRFTALWVFVATCKGAIGNVVLFVSGRRPIKCLVAYLARVLSLVSRLPLVCTGDRTKTSILANPILGHVAGLTAYLAVNRMSVLALWFGRRSITFKRAILSSRRHSLGDNRVAVFTGDGSDFVLITGHRQIPLLLGRLTLWSIIP